MRLAVLAREARLLEFAFEGDADAAAIASAASLESALEGAMEAELPEELSSACDELASTLADVVDRGMTLSAELTDVVVEGVLGASRMPVLSAVLTARAQP
jgi:hypothetical protein